MMCNLETNFPPSFFDLMPHLLVYIVHEMKYLGLVFLHQMHPFERFMTLLEKYVRNQTRPKGCMVQGWATEEVIEFTADYMNLQAIGKPISRHKGRLSGKVT
jgi:glycogen debranching enzyme